MGSGSSSDKILVDGLTKEQLDKLFVQFQAKIKLDYEIYTNKPYPSNYTGPRGLLNKVANLLARFIYNQKDDIKVVSFDLKHINDLSKKSPNKEVKMDLVHS